MARLAGHSTRLLGGQFRSYETSGYHNDDDCYRQKTPDSVSLTFEETSGLRERLVEIMLSSLGSYCHVGNSICNQAAAILDGTVLLTHRSPE